MLPIRYIFISPIQENRRNFENLQIQRTIAKKILNLLFLHFFGPQIAQMCFGTGQRKTICFSFSSFLAFKQTKEQILFQVHPLKTCPVPNFCRQKSLHPIVDPL